VSLGLAVISFYDLLPEVTGRPNQLDLNPFAGGIVACLAAAVLIALFVKLLRLHGSERASMAWVLAGYAGCNAGIATWYLVFPHSHPGTLLRYAIVALNTLGLASFPLFVAYAIVWYRAFALGFITNRVLVYGFFAATIGMMFGSIDWLVSSELTFRSPGIGLGLGAAFAAGLLMQSQYRRAIRLVDRIFLPQRYATGVQLDRIRDAVHSGLRRTDEGVAADVAGALGLASVAVFGRTSDGGFVREVSCGWSDGAAWHVLPHDDLCRTLTRGVLERAARCARREGPLEPQHRQSAVSSASALR
jgi:drug/metabolite transporter (DMT)-like permease